MVKKVSKHKRCEECGFWYKAEKVAGGFCEKCNTKWLVEMKGEAEQEAVAFWNEAPKGSVDYLAAAEETVKQAVKGKGPGWQAVAEAFASKLKAQQTADALVEWSETSTPVKLGQALAGTSVYHCKVCGQGLSWADMKAGSTMCAACAATLILPPTVEEAEAQIGHEKWTVWAEEPPSAEVPPLLKKSKYALEKKAWIAQIAKLAEEKLGGEVSKQETSVGETLIAKLVAEPLQGKLEKGEPVVAFLASPVPATSMTKPYPPPPPLPIPENDPVWKPFKKTPIKGKGKGKVQVKLAELAEMSKADVAKLGAPDPTLPQKVKGMSVLAGAFPHSKVLETIYFRTELQITNSKNAMWMGSTPPFLRPAPSEAQHGFIDSRPCQEMFAHERKQEAKALLQEVLAKDPGGALIVCRYIESRRNAVVTPVGITFGEGHDGATAGKGTWTVPLVPGKVPLRPLERAMAGIPDEGMPFVEVVFPYVGEYNTPEHVAVDAQGYGLPVVVQLRAGPWVDGAVDYVPAPMTVGAVYAIEAGESMDAWPAKVQGLAGTPGLVVWHPGGSLLDHFGANAARFGVPYITSHQPLIGDVLDRKATKLPPDKSAFLAGFVWGLGERIESIQARAEAVAFVLVVGHASLGVMQEGKFGYYLGVACAFMCRLGMAASIGERRHSKRAKHEGKSRDALFKEVLTTGAKIAKYVDFRRRLVEAHAAFKNESWPGGYGGKAWAKCALATIGLDAVVMEVAQREGLGPEGLMDVVVALHEAINQAHNNGWWLNKFAYHTMCDEAAEGRLSVVVQAVRWFDVIGRVEEWTYPSLAFEQLVEGQVLVVAGPTRALAIREAQMRLDWNGEPLVVHVQYRVQGTTGSEYCRQDVSVTEDQSATLHLHCAGLVKGKSWGSGTMEYYPLEVYPGSNVVGVTLGGSVFFPLTALKGS